MADAGSNRPTRHLRWRALRSVLGHLPRELREAMAVHLGRPDIRFSLAQLRRFGFAPVQVLDGGAWTGDWARTCLEVWPGAQVLCVEPQEAPQPALQALAAKARGKVEVKQGLLGPRDAEAAPFTDAGTGSSVLGSTDGPARPMWRIDTLITQGLRPPELVKLDVQGYELEVLAGFEAGLRSCQVLQIELSLLPIAPGAPLIADVLAYLSSRGFVMYDLDEVIRAPSDGAAWQIDAIFCHEESPLRRQRTWR